MFWVYVIKNKEGRSYIGQTRDVKKRLQSHNMGCSYWTSRCFNWQLVYKEPCISRAEAMNREKFFKSGKGRNELKLLDII